MTVRLTDLLAPVSVADLVAAGAHPRAAPHLAATLEQMNQCAREAMTDGLRMFEFDRALVVSISSPGGTVEAMRSELLGLPREVRESDYAEAFRRAFAPDPLLFVGAAANKGRS